MNQTFVLAVVVSAAIAVSVAPAQAGSVLHFHVENPTGASRGPEPVRVGIPVPAAFGWTRTDALRVEDAAGTGVPAQIDALARWHAPPADVAANLKWILVAFDAKAGPRSREAFRVVAGPPEPGPKIGLEVRDDVVDVDCGAARFSVPRRVFAPFGSVTLRNRAGGATDIVAQAGAVAFALPDGARVAAEVTEETTVELRGPRRVVLRQRGALGVLRYTCRWEFDVGSPSSTVDFRIENPRAYGIFDRAIGDGAAHFALLELVQPVSGGAARVTTPKSAATIESGREFEVRQSWVAPGPDALVERGFRASETLNGTTAEFAGRHEGALALSGTTGGVTVVVEGFAENHPKSLAARPGEVRIGLFPEFGSGPHFRGQYATPATTQHPIDPLAVDHYRFEGGRWKSHRVVFDFHADAPASADVLVAAKRVFAPLVAAPDPALVRRSGALGILFAERAPTPGDVAVERFERFLDVTADDAAADPTGRLGRIGLPGFLARGGTYGGRAPYGWDNHGDLPWGDGWCNLHYDWPAALLVGFLRTGDGRLLARGSSMARFRRDYGQNHARDEREPWRGAAYYEKGWWHGNAMPGATSHNWIFGVLLHYLLTGDAASREAAVENADFLVRASPGTWTGWWGSRIPGWAIDGLADAYNVLGDARYRDAATLGVARYEALEMQDGGQGHHLNPASGTTTVWMENIFFLGAAKTALATGDRQALPLLARMRNWFKRDCIVPGAGAPAAMTLPAAYESWSPRGGVRPSVHHLWSMLGCLSYSAVLFEDNDDRLWATALFEAVTRYWQEAPSRRQFNPLNAATWSPITMRPLAFPNSESKVLANVLNFGAPHLGMRALMSGRP